MKISRWRKSKKTVQKPCYAVSPPCNCGCSPYPFVYIFDGKLGITVEFETVKEVKDFINFAMRLSPSLPLPSSKQKKKKILNPSRRDSHGRKH